MLWVIVTDGEKESKESVLLTHLDDHDRNHICFYIFSDKT